MVASPTNMNDSLVTDTVIVTATDIDVTAPSTIDALQQWLTEKILLHYQVNIDDPLQIIILNKFKRVLLICPDHQISQRIMETSRESSDSLRCLHFNYSMIDGKYTSKKEYLQLPPQKKLFLISPPPSPPPEFDYSLCEGPPNAMTGSHHAVSYTHLDVYKRQI